MDFFREQDVARRNARLLTLLFTISVLVLILLTNILVAGTLFFRDVTQGQIESGNLRAIIASVDWRLFFGIGGGVAGIIGIVVLINWIRFAQGGKTVAEALGARPAVTSTTDPLERRAQNIVQEIALAANMPVPPLYILNDERGINAFAAGVSPGDAVVAITRGAMVQLTRDELQGVIAHEFSHILNGDMRLSIRLAAMLRGITFVGDIGAVLLRSTTHRSHRRSSNGKNDSAAAALVLGLGLYVIGLLGGLMAGLIKSAISKQKEYLADASSVQFTRNPDGIGNALKVIGGYTPGTLVHTARAEELSHLFFGQVKHRLWTLFATHPPIEKRILKVDPRWNGEFITRDMNHQALEPALAEEMGLNQARRAFAAAASMAAVTSIDLDAPAPEQPKSRPQLAASSEPQPSARQTALAATVIEDAREPLGAMSLILALLWHDEEQSKQIDAVHAADIRGLEGMVAQRGRELADLPVELRLPLIELCLPALKTISPDQYTTFKHLLLQFIRADGRIELSEWCLFQLVRHYLDPEFVRVKPSKPRFASLEKVSESLATALGTLAALGREETEIAFQRGATELELTLELPPTDALDVRSFSKAVETLADCYPLLKVSILKAMATVAAHDGEICSQELTLVKAIAAVIDCPVPNQFLASS